MPRIKNSLLKTILAGLLMALSLSCLSSDFSSSKEILFIDSDVSDQAQLLEGLNSNTVVYQITESKDAVEQMTEVLSGYRNLNAVHIVSHGSDGSLYFGGKSLSTNDLQMRNQSLAKWSHSFNDNADILLYGCDVATSEEGKQFVESLSDITGADVSASSDETGAEKNGSNWQLEYATGSIETRVPFSEKAMDSYSAVLNHFRYGTMSAEPTGTNNEVRLYMQVGFTHNHGHIPTSTNIGDVLCGKLPGFTWGDVSESVCVQLISRDVTTNDVLVELVSDNVGTARGATHTYAGDGPYTISWGSSARESANNQDSSTWRGELVVGFSSGVMANSTPVTAVSPVVYVRDDHDFTMQLAGTDADGDNIQYRWGLQSEFFGGAATEVTFPTNMSLTSSGLITWALADDAANADVIKYTAPKTNLSNRWLATIMVEDLDGSNNVKSKAPLDFIFVVSDPANPPSTFNPGPEINGTMYVEVSGTKTFTITATDEDSSGNPVAPTLTVTNPPSSNPAVWSTSTSTNGGTTTMTITVTPEASMNGKAYSIIFRATDSDGITSDAPVNLIVGVNPNPAPDLVTSAGDSSYLEGAGPIVVDPALSLTDPSSGPVTIDRVSVAIRDMEAGDVLAIDTTNATGLGITGSYNSTTGVLMLTGSASSADYQNVLRTVTFDNTTGVSSTVRTIDVVLGGALYSGDTNHYYDYIDEGSATDWTAAQALAAHDDQKLYGLQGYLATVTSSAENTFIQSKFSADGWIGASDGSSEGDWKWVTGPEAGTSFWSGAAAGSAVSGRYSNWAATQPDDNGGEDYAHFNGASSGQWNDNADSASVNGYIIEYGGSSGDPVVYLADSKGIIVDLDTDGDGIGDLTDTDDDGDGVPDTVEATDGTDPKDGGDFVDTDGDSTPDYVDTDDDGDGIPDVAEGNGDSDGDGINDSIDPDSDNDGIPDSVELATGDIDNDGIDDAFDVDQTGGVDANNDGIDDDAVAADTDGDGTPDYQDVDSDGDGIPDVLEAASGVDTDLDGIDDTYDVDQVGGPDVNGDGIADNAVAIDTDGDGTPDFLDIDSDNDGILDSVEVAASGTDTDVDGIDDAFDVDSSVGTDSNGDGIIDSGLTDTDGDGVPDFRDLDSDNDTITDVVESGLPDVNDDGLAATGATTSTPQDTDGDTIPDYIDLDSDGDGEFDIVSANNGTLDANNDGKVDTMTDTDEDGIPDVADSLPSGFGIAGGDLDEDGQPDSMDSDDDNDGISDALEGNGDSDGDGVADRIDRDSDNDGLPDSLEVGDLPLLGTDTNGNGIDDGIDVTFTGGSDTNGDGVDDAYAPLDSDGDGLPDYADDDSDNDGVSDIEEISGITAMGIDTDQDGIDDAFDVDVTGGVDANSDGVDDALSTPVDTDGDGIYNHLDPDSDNDGFDDLVENGDYNNDGIIDRLQKEESIQTAREGTGGGGSVDFILLQLFLMLLLYKAYQLTIARGATARESIKRTTTLTVNTKDGHS